jgi:hypothetical protein
VTQAGPVLSVARGVSNEAVRVVKEKLVRSALVDTQGRAISDFILVARPFQSAPYARDIPRETQALDAG